MCTWHSVTTLIVWFDLACRGADLVEVAPAYDNADVTSIAAADLVHDFLAMIQMESPPPKHNGPFLMKGKAEL